MSVINGDTLAHGPTLAALLNPGLLYLGLGAVSVPILIHLLNRRRFQRVRWAAVDFLREAQRQNRRRLQIEEWILLALRCLAMLLIGLLLARWFLEPRTLLAFLGSGSRTTHLVVLDDSFSMQQRVSPGGASGSRTSAANLFVRGTTAVGKLVRRLHADAPADRFALYVTSQPDAPVEQQPTLGAVSPDALDDTLASLRCSFEPARWSAMAEALDRSLDEIQQDTPAIVYIVSDFQRRDWGGSSAPQADGGPMNEAETSAAAHPLATLAERGAVRVVLVDVGSVSPANVAIESINARQAQAVAGIESRYEVRFSNHGRQSSEPTSLDVYVGDAARPAVSVPAIPAGQYATIELGLTFPNEGFDALTVEQPADALALDDVRYRAEPVTRALRLLVVDGEASADRYEDEVFLLTVALRPEGPQFSGNEVTVIEDDALETADFAAYHAVILANVYRVSDDVAERLRVYVAGGGGLVVFPGDQVDHDAYNRTLWRDGAGLLPRPLGAVVSAPADRAGFALTGVGAKRSLPPRLAVLDDRLLGEVRVWRYVDLSEDVPMGSLGDNNNGPVNRMTPDDAVRPPVRVLMRIADESRRPFLVSRPFKQGRVVLAASTVDKEWNNLADRPVFVVLAMELIEHAARTPAGAGSLRVGETIRVPFDAQRYEPPVLMEPPTFPRDPAVHLDPQPDPHTGAPDVRWPRADVPGLYRFRLASKTGGQATHVVAVNIDPAESDLQRAGEAQLRRALPGLNVSYTSADEMTRLAAADVRRELWPVVWTLLVVTLIVEQFLGWYFGGGRNVGFGWSRGRS